MSKKYNVSVLEQVIQQAWAEPSLISAKEIVKSHIDTTNIKSKDTILSNLDSISSKRKLDQYLANSLLSFEGLKVGI